jgi:hypothetical protein
MPGILRFATSLGEGQLTVGAVLPRAAYVFPSLHSGCMLCSRTGYIPALRAARVNPSALLRGD